MKILLLVLIAIFVSSQAADSKDDSLMISFETFTSIKDKIYSLNANYFEDLKIKYFGAQRKSWNGILNGFNGWSGFVLGEWWMNGAYQDKYIAGFMFFVFKMITLQYINVAQLVYDIYSAYLAIRAELYNCYGKEVIEAFEVFWLKTPLYLEVTAIVKFLISENAKILPNAVSIIVSFLQFDFLNAYTLIGKYAKSTYDMLKTL